MSRSLRTMPLRISFVLLVVFLLAALVGCEAGNAPERVPLDREAPRGTEAVEDLPPEVQLHLDSGNLAYRSREYQEALLHFGEVTRLAPELAAGWYGIGMTQGALGNVEAADSAMMRVHRLAPEVPLQHPEADAPHNPHPAPPPETGEDREGPPGY